MRIPNDLIVSNHNGTVHKTGTSSAWTTITIASTIAASSSTTALILVVPTTTHPTLPASQPPIPVTLIQPALSTESIIALIFGICVLLIPILSFLFARMRKKTCRQKENCGGRDGDGGGRLK
ncbi:hypothetical protein BCR34DRAFT_158952 [Clohesyomyces aquaticus]|uniref:Uncharacterized protein n=1 Tax=Clohesyomyces aquaticus TaxID=1231657 RepID=A0A1Y1YJ07_9PLEO|nr:hypothetical protein BCR34DRAFT_158952 [Clohesyomyces aquaticus]